LPPIIVTVDSKIRCHCLAVLPCSICCQHWLLCY